jgi:hypothetical protein
MIISNPLSFQCLQTFIEVLLFIQMLKVNYCCLFLSPFVFRDRFSGLFFPNLRFVYVGQTVGPLFLHYDACKNKLQKKIVPFVCHNVCVENREFIQSKQFVDRQQCFRNNAIKIELANDLV